MDLSKELLDLMPKSYEIGKLFSMMEVAEQEISDAMIRHPERCVHIWNSFGLFSSDVSRFSDFSLHLWRAHVREILERVALPKCNKDLRNLGTIADACLVFYHCSMRTPLTEDATYAYYSILREIPGMETVDGYFTKVGLDRIHESYPGAIQELISEAQRKTSIEREFPTDQFCAEHPIPEHSRPANIKVPDFAFQPALL